MNDMQTLTHSYLKVFAENMANPEPYQMNYYQPMNNYSMDPMQAWPGQMNSYHHQPVSLPASNPYGPPPTDVYGHPGHHQQPPMNGSTPPYGLPYTSVFDYAQTWQPSVMTHGPDPHHKPLQQQQHDYYQTPGYALADDRQQPVAQQQHYGRLPVADLTHHIAGMSLGQQPVGPSRMDHHQGFGPVTGPHAQPAKALTWADKVRQAPKEAGVKEKNKKVPIGGVAGAAHRKPSPSSNSTSRTSPPVISPPASQLPLPSSQWAAPGQTSMGNGVQQHQHQQHQHHQHQQHGRKGGQWTNGGGANYAGNGGGSGGGGGVGDYSMNGADSVVASNGGGGGGGGGRSAQRAAAPPSAPVTALPADLPEPLITDDAIAQLKRVTNPSELALNMKGARFFVIKSYSEDDVHRSIKYSIWCSTEHGNKRLDNAFKEREGKGPIYLFFSVNASGHFCGIAQMTSAVDYDSQAGVWAQDKWKGLFHVKWLYVKDVPNQQLRSIRLENNENKPVTNSRDTQEVPYEKGRQVVRIIHDFKHTTSLFDDFSHYEQRQKDESRSKAR